MSLLAAAALAACNSASDVLQSAAPQSTQSVPDTDSSTTSTDATPPPASAGAAPASPGAVAAIGRVRLQIAPIVGAPVEAAAPLTERLNLRARGSGIRLAGSTDTTATHVLKGYFSLLSEGKETTVIYVWDIYDPAGNRLHRISGQQKAGPSNGAREWAAVSAQTMQAIADSTVDQLAAWLGNSTG